MKRITSKTKTTGHILHLDNLLVYICIYESKLYRQKKNRETEKKEREEKEHVKKVTRLPPPTCFDGSIPDALPRPVFRVHVGTRFLLLKQTNIQSLVDSTTHIFRERKIQPFLELCSCLSLFLR